MYPFAQNYPQLMNQAMAAGYSQSQLIELRQAFEYALLMSNGVYRAQGVPLLNHLISSASIVMAENQRPELVNVALLHASYVVHLFTNSTHKRNLEERRQEIRQRFGESVEKLLWDYCNMAWYRIEAVNKYLVDCRDDSEGMDVTARDLLTVRLANELDDRLDSAMEYTGFNNSERITEDFLSLCRELAGELQLPVIHAELDHVIRSERHINEELLRDYREGYQLQTGLWQMSLADKFRLKLKNLLRRLRRLAGSQPRQ